MSTCLNVDVNILQIHLFLSGYKFAQSCMIIFDLVIMSVKVHNNQVRHNDHKTFLMNEVELNLI